MGCLTHAFSRAHKWAEMLQNPCILGGPQKKRDKIRTSCLTPVFSGAHKWPKMRHNPLFSGVPTQRGKKSEMAASPLPC